MIEKRSVSGTIFDVCNGLLMTAIFVIMVYPFLYVINCSITASSEISGSLLLLPKGVNFDAYRVLLNDDKIVHAFLVSVARSLLGAGLMLMVTGMAAYVLATPDLVFGKFFRTAFVLTMYISAGVVPTYIFMKQYHLTNSFLVYILPTMCSVFNMILIRNYIEGLGRSLQEAVYVDGGNDMHAYWLVIFPICKPVNAAILLFGILNQWNSFMDTQMYCAMAEELHTLQYVLYNTLTTVSDIENLKSSGGTAVAPQSIKMAITVITVVPVMFVYPFLQKHFVSGIMVGSVKA